MCCVVEDSVLCCRGQRAVLWRTVSCSGQCVVEDSVFCCRGQYVVEDSLL